jgi:L-2-hydroxycarboxylate dehydrogenase (NAD+)
MDYVLNPEAHQRLVVAAFNERGFTAEESRAMARLCESASRHGVRTHNVLKALHLDEHLGSGANPPNCTPRAEVNKRPGRFAAAEVWDAQGKLGPAVAYEAMQRAVELAESHGVGIVSVDHAFHYLWGGGYVLEAAAQGYIAYTACTAALAEVVPFGGRTPTLGTNPHSWAFPTNEAIGYPILIDWATSAVAMGRVQQLAREGKPLPPGAALDEAGQPTTDPNRVAALLPFGAHKGYGLSLIDELLAAMIGGSLPTLRCRGDRARDHPQANPATEKFNPCFFFQAMHPEALSGGAFADGRTQAQNLRAVIGDLLGPGNEGCLLPGQIEHEAALRCEAAGGLIYSEAEIDALRRLARRLGVDLGDVPPLEG